MSSVRSSVRVSSTPTSPPSVSSVLSATTFSPPPPYLEWVTVGAGQTLGEEYVNAIPSDVRTGRIVTLPKRLAWVLLHVLGPYSLTKLYAAIRRFAVKTREKLDQAEARARARARALDKPFDSPSTTQRIVEW